jgi:hypothetical protein
VGIGVQSVVFDDEAAMSSFDCEAEAAGCGAGVANYIGHGFAERKGEGSLFLWAER